MSNDINIYKMWLKSKSFTFKLLRNIVDKNLQFVAITNNMTSKQSNEHSLSLSTITQMDQSYTALKNSILTAAVDKSKTNWIDALSKIRYNNSTDKPSSLMVRLISTCRMNSDQNQDTRDLVQRTFVQ